MRALESIYQGGFGGAPTQMVSEGLPHPSPCSRGETWESQIVPLHNPTCPYTFKVKGGKNVYLKTRQPCLGHRPRQPPPPPSRIIACSQPDLPLCLRRKWRPGHPYPTPIPEVTGANPTEFLTLQLSGSVPPAHTGPDYPKCLLWLSLPVWLQHRRDQHTSQGGHKVGLSG